MEPNEATYMNNMGVCYNALGRYEDARAAYRKAIEMDPTYEKAKENLSKVGRV
jgi:Flp pilus assembly protein TadD